MPRDPNEPTHTQAHSTHTHTSTRLSASFTFRFPPKSATLPFRKPSMAASYSHTLIIPYTSSPSSSPSPRDSLLTMILHEACYYNNTLVTAQHMHITADGYPMAGFVRRLRTSSGNATQLSVQTTGMPSIRQSLPEAPTSAKQHTHFTSTPISSTLRSIRGTKQLKRLKTT